MSTPQTPQVPAGWYPDPAGSARSRWWDGTQWTDHFSEPYTTAAALKAPEGTNPYTVWIWLSIFLPLITVPLIFAVNPFAGLGTIDPQDPTAVIAWEFSIFGSPFFLILTVLGWVLQAALILFGFLDYRELVRRGVPQPFHWAFVFLNLVVGPVYVIGRGVVTNRRVGRGISVMWAQIAVIVVSIIAAVAWSVILTSTLIGSIERVSGY